MEGQPISVEALERPVEENRPPPNPVEGAGTGPKVARGAGLGTGDRGRPGTRPTAAQRSMVQAVVDLFALWGPVVLSRWRFDVRVTIGCLWR